MSGVAAVCHVTSGVCFESRLTVTYYSTSSLSAWNMNASMHFTAGCLKTRCVLLSSNELFLGG